MQETFISVIIPTRDRSFTLPFTILSVLKQDYGNFELIVSDDCSVDNTVAIVKLYAAKDNRVKLYVNECNLGQFGNRNKAASLAKGKYIKYVDSDDIIYPYSLQIMMDAMLNFPESGLGFCVKYKDSKKPYPYFLNPVEAFFTHYLKEELLMIGPSGLIIKKEAFDEVKGFEEYGMPSDNHLTLKIASKYPVVAMQRDLFWWRIHEGQVFILDETDPQNILNNYLYNTNIIINYSPLKDQENKLILRNLKKIFYLNLIRLSIRKGKPVVALNLFNDYKRLKQI